MTRRIGVLFSDGSINISSTTTMGGRTPYDRAKVEADDWNENEPKGSKDRAIIVSIELPANAIKPYKPGRSR